MNIRLIEIAKRASALLGLDVVHYDSHVLPARHLRLCGREFRDHAYFLRSAQAEADRLIAHCGLSSSSALLDLGCGFGRLAVGVLDRAGAIRHYCGVDVSAAAIDWCIRHIGRHHPSFQFVRLDVNNARYNPTGKNLTADFRLPFGDASFDIGYAYSVFSHMELDDIEHYLSELRRVLRSEGTAFVTLFEADGVPDITINPGDGAVAWQGPLHCVRYRREFIEARLQTAGFAIAQVSPRTETDGQSGYYLRRTSS